MTRVINEPTGKIYHCIKCGWVWSAKLPLGTTPKSCPRCKRYNYSGKNFSSAIDKPAGMEE